MYSFGDPNEIQIQYTFLEEDNPGRTSFDDTWGEFRIHISGYDLCEYASEGTIRNYRDYVYWITEWLCKNLFYLVGYDPFPIPVSGNNALELLENADARKHELLDAGNESEMLLLDQARFDWSFRHSWFASRGGSILPFLVFRRVDDFMEISWDNVFWEDHGIRFTYPLGCQLVRIGVFKKVVLDFLHDYLEKWEMNAAKHNERIEVLSEWNRWLDILR